MDLLWKLLEGILHLDQSLDQVFQHYGALTYGFLWLIVFCETGLVITPFLPGDSLLFAAGAFAAKGSFNLGLLWILLASAAILGDAANYSIGYYLGPQLHEKGKLPFIKQKYLDRTHRFYEKYGKMTIVLARFVPIVRTFAPFLAGVGSMRYIEFAIYNVTGGIAWVSLFLGAGYFFGELPVVKNNFTLVILAIIVVSIIPIVVEYIRHRGDAPEAADSE